MTRRERFDEVNAAADKVEQNILWAIAARLRQLANLRSPRRTSSMVRKAIILVREIPASRESGWVIHVGSGLSAFGGIADMNSWGKVAMGHEATSTHFPRERPDIG